MNALAATLFPLGRVHIKWTVIGNLSEHCRIMFGSRTAILVLLSAAKSLSLSTKRGLATNEDVSLQAFKTLQEGQSPTLSWQYNWDSNTTHRLPQVEFVPMLWGTNPDHARQWTACVNYWMARGSGHLLAFNEPDRPEEANLQVWEAVQAWKTYMEPFQGQAKLGAPAVSGGGLQWITDFIGDCVGCHIDFIPVHWYGSETKGDAVTELKQWIGQVCAIAGHRKVWLTEVIGTLAAQWPLANRKQFKSYGSVEYQSEFLRQVLPFLDGHDCVSRYSYFGTNDRSSDMLANGDLGLSASGRRYMFDGADFEVESKQLSDCHC